MGELINLRRAKKAAERVAKENASAANRIVHGTPKHHRKAAKAEKQRTDQKIGAHKLDVGK
ncbi:MAG TPA: DUF4169 family protein [Rhizomicrobium sp.]|nr:DUF4169 family protein [Rhizomicrobium sp.]